MAMIKHPFRRVLRVVMAAEVIGVASFGHAQDDNEPSDDAPAPPARRIYESEFDGYIFRASATEGRHQLDDQLTWRIQDVDRLCLLTDAQKAKLRLAGRGDIKRFFNRVDERRMEFKLVRNDQAKLVMFLLQRVRPLRLEFNTELFGEGSIFAKTLVRILNEQQTISYNDERCTRKIAAHRALIRSVVKAENRSLNLSAEKCRQLIGVLEEETKPPRRSGPYDSFVLLVQASRLPEAKIRPLFNDDQWDVLSQRFQVARTLEPNLRECGVLPEGMGMGMDKEQDVAGQ
jgi:hypothetical protein